MMLRSEFANVMVELDDGANGPRLKIYDIKGQKGIYLDPLELESLAWVEHDDLAVIIDPSFRRWVDERLGL